MEKIEKNANNPRTLFNIINTVINPPTLILDPSPSMCENFLDSFIIKIENLRRIIPQMSGDSLGHGTQNTVLNQFELISFQQLLETVSRLKPTGSAIDMVPPWFLKENIEVIGPSILQIVNKSLNTGTFPRMLKQALVQPILKKPNLDQTDLTNFRPVSHLSFMSKILEKVVFNQLHVYLEQSNIGEVYQSGFKKHHSTETALVKVFNDLLMTVDAGDSAVLVLLDLTAAFDTIDHTVMLSRLEEYVGIQGKALNWFKSYLTARTMAVRLGPYTSRSTSLKCGVPQGSILAPMLFSLYMLPLGDIFKKYDITFHCYADDLQIYLPLQNGNNVQSLMSCLSDLKSWLACNFLYLNEKKTEVVVFGPRGTKGAAEFNFGSLALYVKDRVKNLGVYIDSALKLNAQVNYVVKSSFFHLRNLAKMKSSLTYKSLEIAIHALISSRLDYCNSLYKGISQASIQRLQKVQNAAARLLTNTKKREHITPSLVHLHWLPVQYRIDFKLLLLVYKSLHGLAPTYLSDLLIGYKTGRTLRSSTQNLLKVPRTKLSQKGDRAFGVVAPKLWNSLPPHVRDADSVHVFKVQLKTHLFEMAYSSF